MHRAVMPPGAFVEFAAPLNNNLKLNILPPPYPPPKKKILIVQCEPQSRFYLLFILSYLSNMIKISYACKRTIFENTFVKIILENYVITWSVITDVKKSNSLQFHPSNKPQSINLINYPDKLINKVKGQ